MSGPIPLLPYPCSDKVRHPLSWADRTYPSPPMLPNPSLNGGGGVEPFAPKLCSSRPSRPASLPHPRNPILPIEQNTSPQVVRWRPGVGRPHRRADRRMKMWTSSGARAFASESRTRRFSFRRACEWSLARHRAQGKEGVRNGGPKPGEGVQGGGAQCGLGPGRGAREGERGGGDTGRGGGRPPPHTHDRPVRDVVLAQHGGQLSVREDRVVVHGGRRRPSGCPGLATRA